MNELTTASSHPAEAVGFRRELDAALEKLPDHYREPLVLFHLEGASLDEVADCLSLNPNTLRTRLSRAREMLRSGLRRRGIELASTASLCTLFAAETKAATLSPALFTTIVGTALKDADSISPHIFELASSAFIGKTTILSAYLTTLIMIMKTKVALTAAVLLVLAAVCVPIYHSYNGTPQPPTAFASKSERDRQPVGLPPHGKPGGTRERLAAPPVATLSDTEIQRLLDQVFLMTDETERLQAIRERLGINVSDEAYQKTIKAYGYQISPAMFGLSLYGAWMEEDPRAGMAWCEKISGQLGADLTRYFLNYWLKIDAPAALAYAKEQQMPPAAIAQLEGIAEEWKSRVYPESAAAFSDMIRTGLEANPDIQSHRGSFMDSMGEWASRDPRAAAEFALTLDDGIKKEMPMLAHAMKLWARSDPDAALAWAEGLSDEAERWEAIAATLPSWQVKHSDQAVDLGDLPDSMHREIILDIVKDWALINPAAAMEYTMKLEDQEFRKQTLSRVAASWARKDLETAEQWIGGLPQGELRDLGLEAIVGQITWGNFETAASLTRQIQNGDARRKVSQQVIQSGLQSHLPAALDLAGELPQIHYFEVTRWARKVKTSNPEGIPAFQSWLEKANSESRIRLGPGGIQPGPYGETAKDLSPSENENVEISQPQYDKLLDLIRKK